MTEIDLTVRQLELPTPPKNNDHVFYVILHGLVSIVQHNNKFRIYMIDMGKDHEYLAGTWLAETTVPKGAALRLTGVSNTGRADLDVTANPVVKLANIPDVNQPEVYAVIDLPQPRKIYSLHRGKITLAKGKTLLEGEPKTLSALQVLEYSANHLKGVSLKLGQTTWWEAEDGITLYEGQNASVSALHLFNMPVRSVGQDHPLKEFALSADVMDAEVALKHPVRKRDVIPDADNDLPPGLSRLELGDLDTRGKDVSSLVLGFIRVGDWNPPGQLGGTCDGCCGGVNGRRKP